MTEHALDFAPGNVESPIRIFVGSEPEQELALKVLEHSIRRHATMSVKVEPLYRALHDNGIAVPAPTRPDLKARTPFSYQRFAIPALKGYSGRAVYFDSDMQVFDDVKKLWTMDFNGAPILAVAGPGAAGRRPQFSVMLLDCEALDWDVSRLIRDLDAGRWTYEEFMFEMAAAPGSQAAIPARWNELERYQSGQTALVHYTDMEQQPWLEATNPICHIWCKGLMEAISDGTISRDFVAEEVSKGNARPSLLAQICEGIVDPLTLPRSLRKLDRGYVPPHALPHGRKSVTAIALWRIRTARSMRSMAWRFLNSVGLWSAAKMLRQTIKVWRQNERIKRERRRRSLPT